MTTGPFMTGLDIDESNMMLFIEFQYRVADMDVLFSRIFITMSSPVCCT